jgi:hypothetical protein
MFQHGHRMKVRFKMEFDLTRTMAPPLQVRDALRNYISWNQGMSAVTRQEAFLNAQSR